MVLLFVLIAWKSLLTLMKILIAFTLLRPFP